LNPFLSPSLRRKLLWLIGGRAAVITLLLGSAILIQIKSPGSLPIDPFFFIIGLTYALTVVYSLALKHVERHRWIVDLQLGCDAIIVSAIVLLTGGVTSYFASLYALPIIAASAIQSWRGGMTVAVLSSLIYAGIAATQYFEASGLPLVVPAATALPPGRVALFTVGLNVFGFFTVAALTGYLAEGLRRADAKLELASTELADLQAFSQHVIDSLTSGLTTTDMSGTVMTFNRAAEAITGFEAQQVIGQHVEDVLQFPPELKGLFESPEPEDLEGPASERAAARALRDADGRRRLPRIEIGFCCADSRQIELGLSGAPLMTPRGETGFILTFQDVTESRKQDREGRVQQRLAAVGEMAAGIAHEIRNPLASMSGSIQILRQELPLTEEQGQLMDIVLRESERLNDTIRSFLAYARPQRQAMTRIDVRQVVTDTARLLENSPELHETHEIAVDVPDSAVLFQADEGQIRQIVWNLATNGLRAMPDGGRLTLSVASPEDDDGHVALAIADEGVGIAPEELDGIFQPFRGAFARGTGLGLSIVHRIVSDYGGEVRVTSNKGEGTTVRVKFPAAVAAVSAVAPGFSPANHHGH
jgi:two-component system sensor histidine kinase PilS (NtrC family)